MAWGPVALESPRFDFLETDYYEPTMGPGLLKQFWAFERAVSPAALVDAKLQTGQWETAYANLQAHPEPRPLKSDPGYVTLGKLVLASTKDHAHRMYLDRGIFAEVTLNYQHGTWRPAIGPSPIIAGPIITSSSWLVASGCRQGEDQEAPR